MYDVAIILFFFQNYSQVRDALHSSCPSSPVGVVGLLRGGVPAEARRQLGQRHRDSGRRRGRDAGRPQVPGRARQILLPSGETKVTRSFP
jgi:hypothetical protein